MVLMNFCLRDKLCNDSLRYIDWSVQNPPKTLAEDDFLLSRKEIFLFCCKLNFVKSSVLIRCFGGAGKTDRNPPERASLRVSWWSSKVPVSRRNLLS